MRRRARRRSRAFRQIFISSTGKAHGFESGRPGFRSVGQPAWNGASSRCRVARAQHLGARTHASRGSTRTLTGAHTTSLSTARVSSRLDPAALVVARTRALGCHWAPPAPRGPPPLARGFALPVHALDATSFEPRVPSPTFPPFLASPRASPRAPPPPRPEHPPPRALTSPPASRAMDPIPLAVMADWWNSIQKGATEAAETTRLVSLRTKLQAEVMYVESQIKGALQKFGVEVFPHMENNNSAQVQQHFVASSAKSTATANRSPPRTSRLRNSTRRLKTSVRTPRSPPTNRRAERRAETT